MRRGPLNPEHKRLRAALVAPLLVCAQPLPVTTLLTSPGVMPSDESVANLTLSPDASRDNVPKTETALNSSRVWASSSGGAVVVSVLDRHRGDDPDRGLALAHAIPER